MKRDRYTPEMIPCPGGPRQTQPPTSSQRPGTDPVLRSRIMPAICRDDGAGSVKSSTLNRSPLAEDYVFF